MEEQPQTYRFHWRGVEIEARYRPLTWATAHLEIEAIRPERAKLPVTDTGYQSYFHPVGTIEAHGGDVVAYVVVWLDEEAKAGNGSLTLKRTYS